MLIESGADEKAKTKTGETPIVLARREGNEIQRNLSKLQSIDYAFCQYNYR